MSDLTEKQLLQKLNDFQKHELPYEKRNRVITAIRNSDRPKKKTVPYLWTGTAAIMLIMIIFGPAYWFMQTRDGGTQTGGPAETVEPVEQGEIFSSVDENGNLEYVDQLYGIPNKVGVLKPVEYDWVAEDYRSVSKIMIHLWGDSEKLIGESLRVTGTHVETGMRQHLANPSVAGGVGGSDAHAITSFQPFERPGEWILTFKVGKEKFGEFSVYVKEPYVQIGNATLLISQEDLKPAVFENVSLEVGGKDLPAQIELELLNVDNPVEYYNYSLADKEAFTRASDNAEIYSYNGKIEIKNSGRWRFTVLGQQSELVVVD
ncbi:hypothetical protein CVD25_02120 [Bacillus canaveralius]|uniref:DUF4871 domain-containing protein n=1 Tax=Bacillus canaveralius TaxID=1403243 RepID=A0A2N5GPH9_9BACI|nr:hypothetical protein [Bacillus canaveralius]PLR84431.1 hypothetical protein CU635_06675 [Bacillus canaveralius]PLS00567.1 hypothetical protein CVD25_02120 [Bacillus canaveralius]RSK57852.1 hypothetical protein EJA13_00325 [Bacillus canaveralius]